MATASTSALELSFGSESAWQVNAVRSLRFGLLATCARYPQAHRQAATRDEGPEPLAAAGGATLKRAGD